MKKLQPSHPSRAPSRARSSGANEMGGPDAVWHDFLHDDHRARLDDIELAAQISARPDEVGPFDLLIGNLGKANRAVRPDGVSDHLAQSPVGKRASSRCPEQGEPPEQTMRCAPAPPDRPHQTRERGKPCR